MIRLRFEVRGIVQGVGFRPFVAREATKMGIFGFAENTPYGALVECEGTPEKCAELKRMIIESPPPGAEVFSLKETQITPLFDTGFTIKTSKSGVPEAAVSPDLGVCKDCERELFDKNDRRYMYPFLNCTACGPRFTILEKIPYDRENTTMKKFVMCKDCEREYKDMYDRRFHAQPTACPVCGPQLQWLEKGQATENENDPIKNFERVIKSGGVAAVKGIGGFHLACDGRNENAVKRVREIKHRYEKPLAVMVRDIETAESLCEISDSERAELLSPRKPIVLLKKRIDCDIAQSAAINDDRLGVMLPYTPLHLIITKLCPVLIMTSANISDSPMPYKDEDVSRILDLCGAVLNHTRPILRRMDDSVCFFLGDERHMIRRARGFAPQPIPAVIKNADSKPHILSFGAQQKNTFCLLKSGLAYLSGHIGDLDEAETCDFYEREIPRFLSLFGGEPQIAAYDMHPDYVSTRVAKEYIKNNNIIGVPVQHHHAHFAAVLAENGAETAAGLIFDGTGYGTDGKIWGGELLYGSAAKSQRIGSLLPLSLPGGDAAIREPWRIGLLAALAAVGEEKALALFSRRKNAEMMLKIGRNENFTKDSSGFGRLFDAAATIAGLSDTVSYEGQAAVIFEKAYDESAKGQYSFEIVKNGELYIFDWRPVIRALIQDIEKGESAGVISARFHRAAAVLIKDAAELITGEPVALSGGVFQNSRMIELSYKALSGRKVLMNHLVPCNDGGISYGQAATAASANG